MPSTHLSLHYHVIFSTKERRRVIADVWRDDLHAYIGGILRDMNAVPEAIGGPGDHAHACGNRATSEAWFIGMDPRLRGTDLQ